MPKGFCIHTLGARIGVSLLTRTNDASPTVEISIINEAALSSPEFAPADLSFFVSTGDVSTDLSNPQPVTQTSAYAYNNPAGCSNTLPENLSSEQMIANVQAALGDEFNLAERLQTYIWNGELGTMLDVQNDPYVFEFIFNIRLRIGEIRSPPFFWSTVSLSGFGNMATIFVFLPFP